MAISDEDLEDLLTSMARIIDRYGDVYWPIFERLEGELQQRRFLNEPSLIRQSYLEQLLTAVLH